MLRPPGPLADRASILTVAMPKKCVMQGTNVGIFTCLGRELQLLEDAQILRKHPAATPANRRNIDFSFGARVKHSIQATSKMDVDDEDDFYAPDDGSTGGEQMEKPTVSQPEVKPEQEDDGLEEGEEEDEDDDDTSDSVL